jgi:hypothetical protein
MLAFATCYLELGVELLSSVSLEACDAVCPLDNITQYLIDDPFEIWKVSSHVG